MTELGATMVATFHNRKSDRTRGIARIFWMAVLLSGVVLCARVFADSSSYQPGVRPARDNAITITDVHSNKVHYKENETATTTVTITSTLPAGSASVGGALVVYMHLDVDTKRQVAIVPFGILPGVTSYRTFSYSVGPETYGRGVEVQFQRVGNIVVDSWTEFYAVGAEYFRVQQHTYHGQNNAYTVSPWTTYLTQRHYFADEPTDFGVHTPNVEQYISAQGLYLTSVAGRKAEINYFSSLGVDCSFYQLGLFDGQMGFDEVRKHPEYAMYDANGQPAIDVFYGNRDPMLMASPIEVGPNRQAKPYLDKTLASWQHIPVNLASEDAVVYEVNCIKQCAADNVFTGIYFDGTVGVTPGYCYDGVANVPSGTPEAYAALNARNHQQYSQMLKQVNPNFGTWYNWGSDYLPADPLNHGWANYIGSGTGLPGDVGEDSILAATSWQNVMLLRETGSFYNPYYTPSSFLEILIHQRDWAVQKYGANAIVGYSDSLINPEVPGIGKWAWATINYIGAQMIATQMHFNDAFLPSHRPTLQFLTRYSRLIWSPDVKVVPNSQALVTVDGASNDDSAPTWWDQFIYKRVRTGGYDLIVHLVRKPPTAMTKWDPNWVDEPSALTGVTVSYPLGTGSLQDVRAIRPYLYEEDQQPVETVLQSTILSGKANVTLPAFKYHTMLVFRVTTAS